MGHTKEPWRIVGFTDIYSGSMTVAATGKGDDASRIVACVNACEGIPTEYLETERYLQTASYRLRVEAEQQIAFLTKESDGRLDELKSLLDQRTNLKQQRDRAEQQLKQVLWDDPESEPSFGPAFGDLLAYLNHQEPFPSDLYAMMASGSRLWLQMKDKLSTIEQQRDELLAALQNSDHSPKCAVRDRDAFDDREPCSCGRDAAIAKVKADLL